MKIKYGEILPPMRMPTTSRAPQLPAMPEVKLPTISTTPPSSHAGDTLTAWWDRGQYKRNTLNALARAEEYAAEAEMTQQHTALVEAHGVFIEKMYDLAALHSNRQFNLAYQQEQSRQHMAELHHTGHRDELTRKIEINRILCTLEDSEQQLAAQREHGRSIHDLRWDKVRLEMLDVQMDDAERRLALQRARGGGTAGNADIEILYSIAEDLRQQLAQHNLSTDKIDEVLARRRAR